MIKNGLVNDTYSYLWLKYLNIVGCEAMSCLGSSEPIDPGRVYLLCRSLSSTHNIRLWFHRRHSTSRYKEIINSSRLIYGSEWYTGWGLWWLIPPTPRSVNLWFSWFFQVTKGDSPPWPIHVYATDMDWVLWHLSRNF